MKQKADDYKKLLGFISGSDVFCVTHKLVEKAVEKYVLAAQV